jgi:hypothetical protein
MSSGEGFNSRWFFLRATKPGNQGRPVGWPIGAWRKPKLHLTPSLELGSEECIVSLFKNNTSPGVIAIGILSSLAMGSGTPFALRVRRSAGRGS